MNLPGDDRTGEGPPSGDEGQVVSVGPAAGAGSAAGESPAVGESSAESAAAVAREAARRRKLDEIFGDVLPTVTRDEVDDGQDRAGGGSREQWYRDNRPPHHD